jgi:subtilisin family serine protease
MKTRLLSALALVALWIGVSDAQQPGTEIIAILRPGQSIDKVNSNAGTHTVRQITGQPIYLLAPDVGGAQGPLQKLLHNPTVDTAEFNRSTRFESGTSTVSADDTSLVRSMAALLDGQTRTNFYGTEVLKAYVDQPALQIIGVGNARNISTGTGTQIAYIDTGVDFDHPALRPWLDPGIDLVGSGSVSEFDGLSPDITAWVRGNNSAQLDTQLSFLLRRSMAALLDDGSGNQVPAGMPPALGHGTLVAGVLHAVAPQARIVPIRAFDAYGMTTMFRLAEGIYRASDLGVDVLNMSFSTTEQSETLRRAILYAQQKGVALVASIGNDAADDTGIYPAAWDVVSGVAATDFNDRLASFSNYGSNVSVSAPGAFVISTAPGGRYAMAWGTSFSAPIVSGAIAVVASLRPPGNPGNHGNWNTAAVLNTADPIDDKNPGYARDLGKGRVNLPNALRWHY